MILNGRLSFLLLPAQVHAGDFDTFVSRFKPNGLFPNLINTSPRWYIAPHYSIDPKQARVQQWKPPSDPGAGNFYRGKSVGIIKTKEEGHIENKSRIPVGIIPAPHSGASNSRNDLNSKKSRTTGETIPRAGIIHLKTTGAPLTKSFNSVKSILKRNPLLYVTTTALPANSSSCANGHCSDIPDTSNDVDLLSKLTVKDPVSRSRLFKSKVTTNVTQNPVADNDWFSTEVAEIFLSTEFRNGGLWSRMEDVMSLSTTGEESMFDWTTVEDFLPATEEESMYSSTTLEDFLPATEGDAVYSSTTMEDFLPATEEDAVYWSTTMEDFLPATEEDAVYWSTTMEDFLPATEEDAVYSSTTIEDSLPATEEDAMYSSSTMMDFMTTIEENSMLSWTFLATTEPETWSSSALTEDSQIQSEIDSTEAIVEWETDVSSTVSPSIKSVDWHISEDLGTTEEAVSTSIESLLEFPRTDEAQSTSDDMLGTSVLVDTELFMTSTEDAYSEQIETEDRQVLMDADVTEFVDLQSTTEGESLSTIQEIGSTSFDGDTSKEADMMSVIDYESTTDAAETMLSLALEFSSDPEYLSTSEVASSVVDWGTSEPLVFNPNMELFESSTTDFESTDFSIEFEGNEEALAVLEEVTSEPTFLSQTEEDSIMSTSEFVTEQLYLHTLQPRPHVLNPNEILKKISQKQSKTKMPLEALLDEPDLQFLAKSVSQNENFPVLKKVGLTMFAPVDESFKKLPIDLEALSPEVVETQQFGTDAFEAAPQRQQKSMLYLGRNLAAKRNNKNLRGAGTSERTSPLTQALVSARGPYSNRIREFEAENGAQLLETDLLVNPPMFESEFRRIHDSNRKDVMKDFEQLIMYHVVKRVIPPAMIVSKGRVEQRTESSKRNLTMELRWADVNGEKIPEIWIGNQARVLEIITCKQGYIYKIDQPIFPSWTPNAPSIVDFIRHHPHYTKMKFLLDSARVFDDLQFAGPITMILIPDYAWKIDGIKLPECFFRMLAKPENSDVLEKMLKWTMIPGLWKREDILKTTWMPNAMPPSLVVSNINMKLWHLTEDARRVRFNATRPEGSSNTAVYDLATGDLLNDETPISLPRSFDLSTLMNNITNPEESLYDGVVTLIEGKQVVEFDIPFFNGFGHSVAELPLRPDLDLRSAVWDCMDQLCRECPIVVPFALPYFDGGGLLPDPINPKGYIVPPGIRPRWMCDSDVNWYPPGWDSGDWKSYLKQAKLGNPKLSERLAVAGYTKAAYNLQKLQDKLEEARIALDEINYLYGDWSNEVLPMKLDPNLMAGHMIYKRDVAFKPKICDPPPKKSTALSLYGLDEESPDGDRFGQMGYRDAYDEALRVDNMKKLSMQDFKYVTQWM